jgi:large subunit ribosomal protein L6
MSRIAKAPVQIPSGVEIKQDGQVIHVKGLKGALNLELHPLVQVSIEGGALNVLPFDAASAKAWVQAGTTRSLIQNMVVGVSQGWSKKLQLVGVGYRAQVKGKVLSLSLGFSHPVDFNVPDGINIETPSQTEIVVSGFDRDKVGQVSSDIRSWRPPEPYKGKGIRYANEQIILKDAKKK